MSGIDKMLEEVVGFGQRTDDQLNSIVQAALIKHGFVKNAGQINYPFKLLDYLFFDEKMDFALIEKLISVLT